MKYLTILGISFVLAAFTGCAHQARVYSSPDHSQFTAAKGKLYTAVAAAKAAHAKVEAGIGDASQRHANAVATVSKIVPEVADLALKVPENLKPDVQRVAADVATVQSENAATSEALRTVAADEQTLSARLDDAEKAKAEVDRLETDYEGKVEELTGKLNAAESAWERDSKQIVALRTQSLLFKIVAGVGVLAVAALAFLWFTGRLALKVPSVLMLLLVCSLCSCAHDPPKFRALNGRLFTGPAGYLDSQQP